MSASLCQDGNDGFGAFGRFPSMRVSAMSAVPEAPRKADIPAVSRNPASLLGQLTDGQRDCLRLVYNHMTSKDIARTLNVSPHTVDMRLRTAMKVLGVATRIDAARLLMQDEHGPDVLPIMPLSEQPSDVPDTYQPLIYGSSDMASGAESVSLGSSTSAVGGADPEQDLARTNAHQLLKSGFDPSASGPPRTADALMSSEAAMLGSRSGAGTTDPGSGTRPLATPPLPWGARNTLSVPMRLAWIAGISIGSALSFGAILSALSSLKGLL